jgi:hypothetical protein
VGELGNGDFQIELLREWAGYGSQVFISLIIR